MGLRRIIEYNDIDTRIAQRRSQSLELRQCGALLFGWRCIGFRLEGVGVRRLRIALEACRPDHQDARGQL
jgi:hypothetical protein